jgi:tetratricopeptide (TPR) repeat protein
MKKLKYIILFIVLLPLKLSSQWAIMKSDADSLVQLGTYYVYNVKFDSAEAAFKKVIDKYPEHPAGYFLDAMVDWWKTKLLTNTDKYDRSFIKKITKVVDISDKMLDKNSKDINALFFKAGALGYRGRFYAEKESWIKAASDGAEAFNLLQECRKIAPHNHDIMLGTGIYNYFSKV